MMMSMSRVRGGQHDSTIGHKIFRAALPRSESRVADLRLHKRHAITKKCRTLLG